MDRFCDGTVATALKWFGRSAISAGKGVLEPNEPSAARLILSLAVVASACCDSYTVYDGKQTHWIHDQNVQNLGRNVQPIVNLVELKSIHQLLLRIVLHFDRAL